MRKFYFILFLFLIFQACSFKNQIVYVKDAKKIEASSWSGLSTLKNKIQAGDILKIDVQTIVPEVAIPYNKSYNTNTHQQNLI